MIKVVLRIPCSTGDGMTSENESLEKWLIESRFKGGIRKVISAFDRWGVSD